jgi:hypothetical protein
LRELGLAGITLKGRPLGPRDVHRKITIAKVQIRRVETPRLCVVCGAELAPRRRVDTRCCPLACRQRRYMARLREQQRPAEAQP